MRHARRRRSRAAAPRPRRWLPFAAFLVMTASAIAVGGVVTSFATLDALSTGLPDPGRFGELRFAQPTIVYDRAGSVELGRFEDERRRVVTFAEVPRSVLDATTTAEDRTFWVNDGVDPAAILAAVNEMAAGDGERGASTITQQLVRARLLPEDVVAPGSDRYIRKAKEIIQSLRLTDEYPGEEGKERIITAYLNEIYYGQRTYGIAAAARHYFGVIDLEELTIAQAALLAALPQSPSTLDPYRYAEADAEGALVVPKTSPPVVRRDWILRGLTVAGRWTELSERELQVALDEPVVLAPPAEDVVRGGHFTWQVRRELAEILGPELDLETAGYQVTTTLDWEAQQLAERWVGAAALAPNLSAAKYEAYLDAADIGNGERSWIKALRGKDLNNAALVALDYRTGDILAYVGSAGYARNDLASAKFEPKYDAAGDGTRQPGSAFKPILYAAAFEQRALTPGSLLLDITTEFDDARNWAPRDADQLERGPVLVRKALQYSLNIPAIRALDRVGSEPVAEVSEALGIRFQGGRDAFLQAGLAGAIGTVEVRPLDLTAAFGAFANDGVHIPPRMVLEIRDSAGGIVWEAPPPTGTAAVSPSTAYLVTDILAGNTDPRQNPIWADPLELRNGPDGERRPAAVKTGTTNDARDLATYGYLAPPDGDGRGIAVGVWLGNSDHSMPDTARPATSLTAAAPLWHAFVRDLTDGQALADFAVPDGVVEARIDAWSGGAPGRWTRDTIEEWFIEGTQPGGSDEVDPAGLLYSPACGTWRVDPVGAELGPTAWDDDVADWARRARSGPGRAGQYESATAYFWGERSWGGQIIGPCPRPRATPPPPRDRDDDRPGGGRDKEERPKPTRPPKPPDPPDDTSG